jgi:cytochrome c
MRAAALLALLAAPAWGGDADPVGAILAIEGDAAYGEYLGGECIGCHRAGAADIPAIDWMTPADIVRALHDYRIGRREHQVMNMVAARLGDEEIAALAAFLGAAD